MTEVQHRDITMAWCRPQGASDHPTKCQCGGGWMSRKQHGLKQALSCTKLVKASAETRDLDTSWLMLRYWKRLLRDFVFVLLNIIVVKNTRFDIKKDILKPMSINEYFKCHFYGNLKWSCFFQPTMTINVAVEMGHYCVNLKGPLLCQSKWAITVSI